MKKRFIILLLFPVLFLLTLPVAAADPNMVSESEQIYLPRQDLILAAVNTGAVSPSRNLPPASIRQPKELPPVITVISPKGTRVCDGQAVEISWDYVGDIGGTVTLKAKTLFASGVSVQGGHGTYTWHAPKGALHGYDYAISVEAGNGKAVGKGSIKVYDSSISDCRTGIYDGK